MGRSHSDTLLEVALLRILLVSLLAPAVAAAAVAAAVRLVAGAAPWLRRAAAPPALGAGYAAGHLAALGPPALPPVDTTQGLFYLALAAAVLGLVEARAEASRAAGRRGPGSRVTRLLLIGLALGLSLHPLVRHQWTASAAAVRLTALALIAWLLWRGYDALASRLAGAAAQAAWTTVFAAAAALLLLARTALLAQLAAGIAVALLAIALVGRSREAPPFGGRGAEASPPSAAGLWFLAPMLFALVANGAFYAELGVSTAAALAASPLAAAAGLAVGGRRGRLAGVAMAVAGVAVLLAPFVAASAIEYAADDRGYYDY
ncbi:MAG TPA: hypothetical protein VMS86_03640 [Thermoanaerobaculia bacterium]|nr:hypothetical protein [Thermoanaerobaculia bacterium]